MALAVAAIYLPPSLLEGGKTLENSDYSLLHERRIRYAQEALFGPHPHLPGWYTREALGTPFWSNLQSFPFLPTRLAVLAFSTSDILAVSTNLGAILAALFTFLLARKLGLGRVASATAGWTFSCAGFFSSRVMAGHLPLLEAYFALPLLLWLGEEVVRAPAGRGLRTRLIALGLCGACVALAGHPQLPAYALAAAFSYVLFRSPTRRGLIAATALVLGAGCAAFALFPMCRLVLRSTRVLHLAPPDNDVAFPYERLGSYLFPWKDGYPLILAGGARPAFHGYPSTAWFWDTVCYVGWAPLLAVVFLAAVAVVRRRLPPRPWVFLALAGVLALLAALPPGRRLFSHLPGTILRSPARQLYVTGLVLALAMGAAVQFVVGLARGRWAYAAWPAVAIILAAHAIDLGSFSSNFIHPIPVPQDPAPEVTAAIRSLAGNGRAALTVQWAAPINRDVDDVGFFDSLILARPYRALLDLQGTPSDANLEVLDGPTFDRRALQALGAAVVVSQFDHPDLHRLGWVQGLAIFTVDQPAPRARFVPLADVRALEAPEIHRRLRSKDADIRQSLMLSPDDAQRLPPPTPPGNPATVSYEHESSDEVAAEVHCTGAGVLRVSEAWDPGWSATVDGAPAPILCADDVFLAVPLTAGSHEVRLTFHTPGAAAGMCISAGCLSLLLALAWLAGRDGP